jgi:Bacterial lectin
MLVVRSRGGEGFAFVIHNDHAVSLGEPSSGMGFVGIHNAVAVEFDTWYNPEQFDPWENHVAVVTRGSRLPLSSNHTYELGHATS